MRGAENVDIDDDGLRAGDRLARGRGPAPIIYTKFTNVHEVVGHLMRHIDAHNVRQNCDIEQKFRRRRHFLLFLRRVQYGVSFRPQIY